MLAATILAILVIFGVGGEDFGELMSRYAKDPIKETIVDEDRRKLALDGLDSLKGVIKNFNKGVSNDIEALDRLVEDYDSTPGEFDKMFARALDSRKLDVERLWRKRAAMLTHITADEWQTIISSATAAQLARAGKDAH